MNNIRTVLVAAIAAVCVVTGNAIGADSNEWSAEAANRNLAGLAPAMLARDPAAAKHFFVFPIERPGLLDDVAEENFEAYFPVLFDDGFFAKFEPMVREKGTSLWEEAGWRGFLVADGLMWSHDAKKVTAVNYLSKAEEARLAELESTEIATLSPKLRDGVEKPLFAFEAGDSASGKWRGRVDSMKDGTIRLALWRAGRRLDGPADVVCRVAKRLEGQLGTAIYSPQETADGMPIEEFVPHRLTFCRPFVSLETGLVWEDDGPSLVLVVSEDGKTLTRLGGTECRWSALRAEVAGIVSTAVIADGAAIAAGGNGTGDLLGPPGDVRIGVAQAQEEAKVVPPRESPFSTPLTDKEAAPATGRDTPASRDALLPPEYGLRLGMGLLRARMARPGLRRDGESNRDGSDVVNYSCLLPKRMGHGDILAAFEKGTLAWIDVNWSYDDGWTADEPGVIRKVLDETLRRLGPPTKRWTKETGRCLEDGTFATPDPVENTWHVWQWTKGDEDVIIEIRRASDARGTLRASFSAGALRRLAPDILAFPHDSQTNVLEHVPPFCD